MAQNSGYGLSESNIDAAIKKHYDAALQSYKGFSGSVLESLSSDLKSIEISLSKQLAKTTETLANKLKSQYIGSLDKQIIFFYMEPFVVKQYKELNDSVQKLKLRIYEYINQFCANILKNNVKRTHSLSLFHTSNKIKSFHSEWHSVTSRSLLLKAEIHVEGFSRPTTTWLALGVSKNKKEYGIVPKTLAKEDFMGNIYLNGSDNAEGNYRTKKDLQNGDVFVIQNSNRMVSIYRKSRSRNKEEVLILDDNVEYYFYVAFKGPISIDFHSF